MNKLDLALRAGRNPIALNQVTRRDGMCRTDLRSPDPGVKMPPNLCKHTCRHPSIPTCGRVCGRNRSRTALGRLIHHKNKQNSWFDLRCMHNTGSSDCNMAAAAIPQYRRPRPSRTRNAIRRDELEPLLDRLPSASPRSVAIQAVRPAMVEKMWL